MKRFAVTTLVTSILAMNCIPVFAMKDKTFFHDRSKNVIRSQVTEYKFTDVNLEWWKNYNDDILEGYIVKAVNNNQDLKVATLKVEQARQNVKLQFAKELPTVSIGASEFGYKMPGVTSSDSAFGLPIMVQYEADLFRKNHDKTKSAKKMQEVAKFNERAAYISVASQVGATYFNIIKYDKLISIQNDIIKDRKKIYELMKQRNSQGITSTADLVRADKDYVTATADMVDLKKARDIALNSLAVLIGESPNNVNELRRVSFEEMSYNKPIPKEISSEIIMQRPDYLAAEKQVEKAGLDVRIARKEFLPKIDLIGLIAFASGSAMSSMNWTNALSLFGGQAMLPIFTGGQKFANLRLNKNAYEQILQNYYKTNLVAIQEVNDALTGLKFDNEKYHKNLRSYDMQKADYRYTQKRFEQGIISNLDVLQQKENLLVLNKMITSSKTDCFIDQISLYKAVGGKM